MCVFTEEKLRDLVERFQKIEKKIQTVNEATATKSKQKAAKIEPNGKKAAKVRQSKQKLLRQRKISTHEQQQQFQRSR